MKKWILWTVWTLLTVWTGLQAQCPIKSASEKIVKPLLCLDTLGRNATPDSAHITTYKDDGTFATYFARSTTYPFTAASIDTTRPNIGGTAPVLYWLSETISNIDGTASNATLAINVQLWWKGYATDNMYCVQMVADSLNDAIWKLAALTAAPLEPTTAGRKLDVTATGEAGIDLDNTAGTLAKTTDITGFNDIAATAIVSGGAITTSGGAVSTVTTTTTATNVTTVNGLANNVITAASINADAITAAKIADAAIDSNTFAADAKKLIAIRADSGSALRPTTAGRTLDVTATGEAGIDLDNTAGTLAKTTDITGFNDIAATAVVSSGAITTSGGAVSTVTTAGGWDATKSDSVLQAIDYSNNTRPIARATANTVISVDGSGNVASTATVAGMADTLRDVLGDSLATFATKQEFSDSMRAVVLPVKQRTDSLHFAGVDANPSFLRPTTAGRTLDVASTGEAGVDLSNVNGTLDASEIGADAITAAKIATGAIDVGVELDTTGVGLQSIKAAGDTLLAHAPHANNWGGTAASSFNPATDSVLVKRAALVLDQYNFNPDYATGSGGSGIGWPFGSGVMYIDAVGGTGLDDRIIVIDTATLDGACETCLLERSIMVRDHDDNGFMENFTIERVECAAGVCSLQVDHDSPFAFEVNDSVWFWNGQQEYLMATVSETADSTVQALLTEDTTSHDVAGTFGEAIIEGGLGTGSGSDTTGIDAYLRNHGIDPDTLGARLTAGQAYSLVLYGQTYSAGQLSTELAGDTLPVDMTKVAGSKPAADSLSAIARGTQPLRQVDTLLSQAEAASVTLTPEDIDSISAKVARELNIGTGTSPYRYDVFFIDTLANPDVVVQGANISLFTNSSCTGTPTYWGGLTRTSALGYISFAPDTGVYYAVASKAMAVNSTPGQMIHVTGSGADTVYGYGFASSSRVPVQGLVVIPGGEDTVCSYCDVVFEMVTAGGNIVDTANAGQIVIPRPVRGFTNSSGQVVSSTGAAVELLRTQNLQSQVGAMKYPVQWKYKIVSSSGVEFESKPFGISNSATVIDMRGL